ncbi:hypothetical protein [Plantibacter sp. YIM 135249]|uniref:hypothetical protein n=1 Tax=Plantibacter sp. YIM 135249 TaxID=3423918 RepID=UPI003D324D44
MNISPAFPVGSAPSASEVADWCECVALLQGRDLKRGDLKSVISREDIGNPDLLKQQTWQELRNRQALYGDGWPLSITETRLVPNQDADTDVVMLHAYLCLLALGEIDAEDRTLFEELIRHLLALRLGGSVVRVGHPAREGMPKSFRKRIKDYAKASSLTNLEVFNEPLPKDKDLGMDVVAWLPSIDNRSGYLHFLVQCATGKNWDEKLSDINLDVIASHVKWAVHPVRVFYVLSVISVPQPQWIRYSQRAGWIMDRPRLLQLSAGFAMSTELRDEVGARLVDLCA